MSRNQKKSKAVPIVTVLAILVIAAAAVCFLFDPLVARPQREAIARENEAARAAVVERNQEAEARYAAAIADVRYASTLHAMAAERPGDPAAAEALEWLDHADFAEGNLDELRNVIIDRIIKLAAQR